MGVCIALSGPRAMHVFIPRLVYTYVNRLLGGVCAQVAASGCSLRASISRANPPNNTFALEFNRFG